MGRFYDTSNSQYLDFMYKEPQALMLKAVQMADEQIGTQEKATADLYGRLKFDALSKDRSRREEIITGYKDEIDEMSRDIQANPLAYRKDLTKIRGLSDRIKDDMERGEIGAIQGNYNTRIAYEKELDSRIKQKEISSVEKAQMLSFYDDKYGGADYESTTKYNAYNTGFLAPTQDLFKLVDERGAGWNDDLLEKWGWKLSDRGDGKYIVTTKTGDREITKEELQHGMTQYLTNDPAIGSYLSTRVEHGIFSKDQKDKMLSGVLDYAMTKFEKDHHTESGTVKGDPFSLQLAGHMLKQKDATPLTVNKDTSNWTTLPGGARTYEEAEKALQESKNIKKKTKNGLLTTEVFSALNAKYNAASFNSTQEFLKSPQGKAYTEELKTINDSFAEAEKNGDYSKTYNLMNYYGYDVDKKDFDDATEDMTTVAIHTNNYENQKNAIRKTQEDKFQKDNLTGYLVAKSTGTLDALLDAQVASYLNSATFTQVNTGIYETQETGYTSDGFTSKKQQFDFMTHLKKMEGSTLDFVGTGSDTGTKILTLDGKTIGSDMNTMIEDKILRNYQKWNHTMKQDPEDPNEQIKVYTNTVDGKPIQFEVGNMFYTHDEVGGMGTGMKWKQKISVSDPETGKQKVMSVLVPEERIPLPTEFHSIRNPEKAKHAKAMTALEKAVKASENLVNGNAASSDYLLPIQIPSAPGVSAESLGKGVTKYYVGGKEVSKEVAEKTIYLIQNKK